MADRFWVGGTGNWTDAANHWATTSGGAPGAGNLPTNSDNAIFDAASNATAYTVTINGAAVCLSLNFSAAPSGSGTITWAGSSTLGITGNLTCLSGMTRTYTGAITFNSTSTGRTITMNGVQLNSAVTFSGAAGGWTLQDAFTLTGTTNALTLSNGTLNTNGQAVQSATFVSTSGTRTLTLGATTWTLISGGTTWNVNSGLTLNANTSSLIFSASPSNFLGGGLTYNNATFNATYTSLSVTGANTFTNLTFAAPTGNGQTRTVNFSANQVVSGTLTTTSTRADRRVALISNTIATARTITAAIVSLTDCDFQDITGAGAASPFTGTRIGNRLGNSGITFTAAADKFWVGNGGFDYDPDWALTSGGAGAANNFPLPQDDLVFDANSFNAGGLSFAFTGQYFTGIDFSAIDVGTLTIDGTGPTVLGNFVGNSGITAWVSGLTFSNRGAQSVLMAGITLGSSTFINGPGGVVTLLDTYRGAALQVSSGATFDLNDQAVNLGSFEVSGASTIDLGASLVTLTNNGTAWAMSVTGTLIAGTSTIKLIASGATTKNFFPGDKTYNNIWLSGSGPTTLQFFNGATPWTANDLRVDTPPHTLVFQAGSTARFTTFTVAGAAGNLVTIGSDSAANHNLVKLGAGLVSADYLSISRSQASPANTWYAGNNSTDGGNNTGWVFAAAPNSGAGDAAGGRRIGLGMGLGLGL